MNIFLIVYGIGALVSWVLMAGWSFAYWQGEFPLIAKRNYKEYLVFSVYISFLLAFIWPITEPIMYFSITYKAKHGWRL